jgi:two-component system sensor histidine kinase MtrB
MSTPRSGRSGPRSHRIRAAAGFVVRGWRRSLLLRVVVTTVALCLAVVALLGAFLVDRVASGLLRAKEAAGLAEAAEGTLFAQQQFDAADPQNPARRDQLAVDVVRRLASGGGSAGRNEILLLGSPDTSRPASSGFSSLSADLTLPADLRRQVRTGIRPAYTYVGLPGPAGTQVPGLVVGHRVLLPGAGAHELYYLFPLDEEQATLSLVRRAVAGAGAALVALVGVIAWLVVRQVVRPVRTAARVASRLSAGRLEERMRVHGEDDLARLAAAFNSMATNLQRQIRQLEDLSRLQRRFVSDVSHELRTPLTTVRLAADLLHDARDRFEPSVARSVELLQAELDRFESLLTDLLEISRFDAGAAQLDLEPVDVRELADGVMNAASAVAGRAGSDLLLDAPDEPCVVAVDPRRVGRILRNLVLNAVEHGEGRPVVVQVACSDEAVAVAVRDHGVGLKPGEGALVFNRFWRGDPARARTTGGTGLGLSIALEDAHLHGGWLQAWGEPGDGSQFRLTLPRRAGSELESSPIPLEPLDSRRRRSSPAPGRPGGSRYLTPAGPPVAGAPAGAGRGEQRG